MTEKLDARRAALALFQAALSRRGGLDEALGVGGFARLSPQDRGFARQLTLTTLRRLGPIDRILDRRLTKEPPPPARDLMRLGLAQALWMDTPQFAAVDTSVGLAPKPLRGLVNGVLRAALREPPPSDAPEELAPPWLYARWRSTYGEATAREIAGAIPLEPATDLTARGAIDEALLEALEAERLPGGSLRSGRRGDVATWPGYAEGLWWVQDAAAAIPARLLEAEPGMDAVDLCAAPGGKTLQLAAAGARVVAVDRAEPRLRRLSESLARTGLAAEIVVADAATWRDPRAFDAVLLDAPCSSTGAFRRHPDVLWNARPSDIAPLVRDAGGPARLGGAAREAGRAPGLQRLLAGGRGGRGAGPRLLRRPSRVPARADRRGRGRGSGRQCDAGGLAAHPAPPSRGRDRRLLRRALAADALS